MKWLNTRNVLIVGGALLLAFVLMDVIDPHDHHHLPHPSGLPFFEAIFGAVGCWLIVVVSKWLGKVWLQRPEDYYDA